jgi:hypothetical protein
MTKQLGNGFETSVVMTTLVKNNRDVLVKHVNQELVSTFINLIADKGPQAVFLEFLQSVARCAPPPDFGTWGKSSNSCGHPPTRPLLLQFGLA